MRDGRSGPVVLMRCVEGTKSLRLANSSAETLTGASTRYAVTGTLEHEPMWLQRKG